MSARDFDFFHGSWQVAHRYLRARLAGDDEWGEFTTRTTCRPILGGAVNIDEGEFSEHGYHAMSLRLYNPEEDSWAIYWITSRSTALDPPMVGRFADGAGEFFGADTLDGAQVPCRFLWSVYGPDTCRWEQAYSSDDGKTWETNWYMDFTRI